MRIKFFPNLNIRQRLFFAFFMSLLSILALGLISYYNLSQLEVKFGIVESADDLSNIILEVRRYEKNFFLFFRVEDLNENKKFIVDAVKLVNELTPNIKDQEQQRSIARLSKTLEEYHNYINRIRHSYLEVTSTEKKELMDQLRNSGQKLVQLSADLVRFERKLILKINQRLKFNFVLSIFIIYIFLGFIIFYIISQVVRPLKIIEDTTISIASGNFKKVEIKNDKDEIQHLMMAFNRMVGELEDRQKQLVQAQKLSSIGTLASGIAHQVNNPLNNISTSCQILAEECKGIYSEIAAKMMENIESETFRAKDIVRGLLEYSRNQEFDLRHHQLSEIVDRSVKLVSSQIPTGIEIIKQVPDDILLNLDRQRMQEAFINLILNSVQSIQPGPGKILISAAQDLENNTVDIVFEDSGGGIPEEIRDHIFDPFFTTKDVGFGTGLGLYLVYGIVQSHQGNISCESRIIEGARFIITLPVELAVDANN
jgi:two-component system, NtrC family, sensor kinase